METLLPRFTDDMRELSTYMPILRILLAACSLLFHASANAQIDWSEVDDLSSKDKATIEELARNVYMDNAVKASVIRHLPGSERSFAISGPVRSNGPRRVWQELIVCRQGEGYCRTADGDDSKNWRIGKTLAQQERWRFTDGDWFVDVELGSGISYAEAETIVLAIRRMSLRTTPELESYRNFDASRIRLIRTIDPVAAEYSIEIGGSGGGQSLNVRLEGDDVVLFELITLTA